MTLAVNPKDRFGVLKPPMHLVPPAAKIYMAVGLGDGEFKYGPYNYRENSVKTSVYIAATHRHIDQWWDGEEYAKDSGVHHLAHALACLGIMVDSKEQGNLIDDRPVPGSASRLIEDLTIPNGKKTETL